MESPTHQRNQHPSIKHVSSNFRLLHEPHHRPHMADQTESANTKDEEKAGEAGNQSRQGVGV